MGAVLRLALVTAIRAVQLLDGLVEPHADAAVRALGGHLPTSLLCHRKGQSWKRSARIPGVNQSLNGIVAWLDEQLAGAAKGFEREWQMMQQLLGIIQ